MGNWKTIEKGYLGSLIFEKKLIENEWNVFKPVLENGKVDMIIEKNNRYLKIQIKTIQEAKYNKTIPVRKVSHNMGEYKIKRYTKEDIDYFVGVDIDTEDVYILPIAFSSQYSSSISINNCSKYKNNFTQMELNDGNIIDVDDDNVESLTGNADGNDVGME